MNHLYGYERKTNRRVLIIIDARRQFLGGIEREATGWTIPDEIKPRTL